MRFEVLMADTAERFLCEPHQSVLDSMEQLNRHDIPVGCRGGGCGVCKVQITHGEYLRRRMSRAHISAADEVAGIGLACCVIPLTNLTLSVVVGLNVPPPQLGAREQS